MAVRPLSPGQQGGAVTMPAGRMAVRPLSPGGAVAMPALSCDYLVVGAGATAMAFVDELVHASKEITVVLVDRRAKPGGHWNDAYDFVRLHQPAAFYGVNSLQLGSGGADLTSKYQILAYYETVLASLLKTGRVTWLPHTEHREGNRLQSLLQEGLETKVTVKKRVVTTAMGTEVPSTHPPNYKVDEGVQLVPINGLARLQRPWKRYTVVGAGKTGLDALLHLIDQGVAPENLRWIVSNDCWYLNRKNGMKNLGGAEAVKAVLDAHNVEELYLGYEKEDIFFRVDPEQEATKMRAATISPEELEKIRTVKDIIRHGRVERITKSKIFFLNGEELETDVDTLYVDCSAGGTSFRTPLQPIFQPGRIVLQMVQLPAPTNSAGIIAALELASSKDDWKNQLKPLGAPQELEDWFRFFAISTRNRTKIREALGFRWMWNHRLAGANLTELLGLPLGLFIGAIIWLGLGEARMEAKICKLEAMFEDQNKEEKINLA